MGAGVRRRRVVLRWLAALIVAVVAVAGCSSGSGGPAGPADGGAQQQGAPAQVRIVPAADATGVAPAEPVTVTAQGGTLGDVAVTAAGRPLTGRYGADRTTWTSTGRLAFGTRYQVVATAKNTAGQEARQTSTFATAKAAAQVFPAVSPLRGTTVGVGMPIRVYFDAPVTDRKVALAKMAVHTSVPTEGGWRWFSDTEVHWRPKVYWKAGTQVVLTTDLYGVKLGPGVYGGAKADRRIDFGIGHSHVSVADARTHRFKVYVDGKLTKDFPASLGKAVSGQHTHSGVHVVTDKKRSMTMDSTTYGLALDAGGYRTKVEYATRISNSGEFVHSAPWSVAQQGRANVSHGCINLSPTNAAWFFGIARPGDVVEVVGTPVKLTTRETDVPDWNIPWRQWGE
ncbi:MAG TPA: Ig-like domain-containing protein [Actinoplanes sp.]|nr:Ig-like domain-containing protein [Actinoplanes sp.]